MFIVRDLANLMCHPSQVVINGVSALLPLVRCNECR